MCPLLSHHFLHNATAFCQCRRRLLTIAPHYFPLCRRVKIAASGCGKKFPRMLLHAFQGDTRMVSFDGAGGSCNRAGDRAAPCVCAKRWRLRKFSGSFCFGEGKRCNLKSCVFAPPGVDIITGTIPIIVITKVLRHHQPRRRL